MLEAKLSPCASLLYQWVLSRVHTDTKLKIDLQDFQAWTGEFRHRSYSYTEVFEALSQLKDFNLVNVSRTEVTLEAKVNDLFDPLDRIEEAPTTKTANPWLLLAKIMTISAILSTVSVGIGISLWKLQPETLNSPHAWSALGEKNY
jgi:hypothetical protein